MLKKYVCLFIIIASVFTGTLYFNYYYEPTYRCRADKHDNVRQFATNSTSSNGLVFDNNILKRNYNIDINKDRDVLVFLHIQKTGGSTFGRHLVKDLNFIPPCICYPGKKRCDCLNTHKHNWLFSRYSIGWTCGLHADWTELNACVDDALNRIEKKKRKRRYHYVTMLRDPIQRYLSEWKHVQRGNAWPSARLGCNGRRASLEEVPFCFLGETWTGVNLDEFTSCPHNLAHNRQTRMLANLSLVGCYNQTLLPREKRSQILLESAKKSLRDMAYFGLTEYQLASQFLFEQTFHVDFNKDFIQRNGTHASRVNISDEMQQRVLELNSLDLELYKYAKELFFARINYTCAFGNSSELVHCS